jgi:hypothetical protein
MSNTNKSVDLMHLEYLILVLWLVALAMCYYSDQRVIQLQQNRIKQLEAACKVHNIDVPSVEASK